MTEYGTPRVLAHEFVDAYFHTAEWVGSGRSGVNGAEWCIVLDIPAFEERLAELIEYALLEGKAA